MKSLPILTAVCVSAAVTVWGVAARQQREARAAPEQHSAGRVDSASDSEEDSFPDPDQESIHASDEPSAADLLRRCREQLLRLRGVSAKVTQRIRSGETVYTATGPYLQSHLQLRCDLKCETPLCSARMLQVSDGQVLWTWQKINDEQAATRRDLRRLIADRNRPGTESRPPIELALGGLPALLSSLEQFVEFEAVREQEVDGKRLYLLEGTWTPSASAAWLAGSTGTIPQNLPHEIRCYLDGETLFPRRLQYLSVSDAVAGAPLMTVDWTEVKLNTIPPAKAFEFLPPDNVIPEDVTKEYLSRLRVGMTDHTGRANRN